VKAVESIRPQAGARKVDLQVAVPGERVLIEADGTRVEQIISNLLGNAVKYTPAEGRIRASLGREGNSAKVCIEDSGVGIAADLLPHIFDLFVQGRSSNRRSGQGLGVGLSLVKRLVELHGGKVFAESEGLGKGSRFTVFLPLKEVPDATQSPAEPCGPPAAAVRRILIVEDDVQAAGLLSRMLVHVGCQVRQAYDGEAAVCEAQKFRPHIVFLDISLPGIDGFEVARQIRKESPGSEMVLVALTGYCQAADRQRSKEAGFKPHLAKPVSFEVIQDIVTKVRPSSP